MSFLTAVEHFFSVTETDVVSVVVKIKQRVSIAERDISAALGWIAKEAPTIAADIAGVESVVQLVGIGNPSVAAAVFAANEAVAALNAYATAYNSGTGTVSAVVQGYSALKSAQAAAAKAAAIVALAPTAAPAAIPAS